MGRGSQRPTERLFLPKSLWGGLQPAGISHCCASCRSEPGSFSSSVCPCSCSWGSPVPLDGGAVHEVIVELERVILFVMSVSETSVLAVAASRPCDVGLVGYEMAVLVERCAAALTPSLVAELQTALPR